MEYTAGSNEAPKHQPMTASQNITRIYVDADACP